jgi:hypothetical protein
MLQHVAVRRLMWLIAVLLLVWIAVFALLRRADAACVDEPVQGVGHFPTPAAGIRTAGPPGPDVAWMSGLVS